MKSLIAATVILVALYSAPRIAHQTRYMPPPASAGVLRDIGFTSASPVDKSYRAEFDRCDREDIFEGVRMTGFRRCSTDPNRARALLKFPNGTIFIESKLGLDIDGSQKACSAPGRADQCSTWFEWPGLSGTARFVDSDKFPYVVIPIAGLGGRDDREFRDKTGIDKGDIGVVVFKDKIVPVFVADGGPNNKLGEGSAALFKALGEDRCRRAGSDGHCERFHDASIDGKVLFFLFPRSRIDGLTPDNALENIRREALRRFADLQRH
jgi:Fungal chitosanase of glycosyl hydrolase group 75